MPNKMRQIRFVVSFDSDVVVIDSQSTAESKPVAGAIMVQDGFNLSQSKIAVLCCAFQVPREKDLRALKRRPLSEESPLFKSADLEEARNVFNNNDSALGGFFCITPSQS